jgi:superfamily I DNA and RNA helicase
MKQEKFINVLKKVINEEVRTVIKQELTEIIKQGLENTIQEIKTSPKESVTSKKSNNKVKFKENKFSDILNETTRLTENNKVADYASLMSEDIMMTSKDAQGFGMNRSIQNINQTSVMSDPETGKTLEVDPVIQKAMTRDYSTLMKAIDKKKGNGIPIRK